jgi:hypothetical protein
MAGSERRIVLTGMRRCRLRRLAAFRDLCAVAALAVASVCGLGPSIFAAVQASDDGGASATDAFKLLLLCAVLLALGPTSRRVWLRMANLGDEARRLRSDLRSALVEETDHRTTRALLLGSEADGWLAALLEDEDRNTLFVEAVPRGHSDPGLLDRFPPAAVRFETGLHSGLAFMETREGPFEGPMDAVALPSRPRDLPRHGTVIQEPLESASVRILREGGI